MKKKTVGVAEEMGFDVGGDDVGADGFSCS